MREIVLRVPELVVEDVLDRLLPIVPSGVREVGVGRNVDLKLRGDDLPSVPELRRVVGGCPVLVSEGEVSDDWRRRRRDDFVPDLIGGRLVVRPEWARPSGAEVEIVLEESVAFGGGSHPTTRTCLEILLGLRPAGAFADLGCGSGVLAILAAQLGWRPVVAVDIDPRSVESTRQNACSNDAELDACVHDLAGEPPPPTDGFAANVPAALHQVVASGWTRSVPRVGVLSGFDAGEAAEVADAYARIGLRESDRIDVHGWTVLVVQR